MAVICLGHSIVLSAPRYLASPARTPPLYPATAPALPPPPATVHSPPPATAPAVLLTLCLASALCALLTFCLIGFFYVPHTHTGK